MSAIKDGRLPVELGGTTRHLLFSLNALDEIQDKLGGYDKLDEAMSTSNPKYIKNIKWLLTLLINEGKEDGAPDVTEQQVGKWVHLGNIGELISTIYSAFYLGTTGDAQPKEGDEETQTENDDAGNATGGQAV